MIRPPPRSPLSPYTTLLRSVAALEPASLLHPRAQERLPRRRPPPLQLLGRPPGADCGDGVGDRRVGDRKSTRLNSSHSQISYAVFCLKHKIATVRDRSPSLH